MQRHFQLFWRGLTNFVSGFYSDLPGEGRRLKAKESFSASKSIYVGVALACLAFPSTETRDVIYMS